MRRALTRITILVLLGSLAAADSMYGHVTQVDANHLSIRARYYPHVSFTLTDQTEFLCHKQPVPVTALRVGDLVEVKFHPTKRVWEAVRVKINCKRGAQGLQPQTGRPFRMIPRGSQ